MCVFLQNSYQWLTSHLAEDEAAASRIASKNALESYAYNLRNSTQDEKLADKFDAADKQKLDTAINETIQWLDGAQEAAKEEYEERQKELEAVANPIMQKLYGAAGGAPGGAGGFPGGAGGFPGGAPGGFPGAGAGAPGADGPSVEEVCDHFTFLMAKRLIASFRLTKRCLFIFFDDSEVYSTHR